MRMINASKIALLGGAVLGAAFLLNGCVVDDSDGTRPINTGSIGGSQSYAGNTSYAGYDNGGYGGDYYAGSGGDYYGGSAGYDPGNDDVADVRFLDLIPDSGAIDICLRASGSSTWQGPLGATYGIPVNEIYYPAITRYVSVPTGSWSVRIVDGAANDCNSPLAADQTTVSFQKDVGYSLVLEGQRSAFSLQNVVDRGDPKSGTTGWQAINALTNQGSVEFGLLDGNQYVGTILENLAPFSSDQSGDADPTNLRPAFILTSDQQTLVAAGATVDATVGAVHAVFLHGVNYTNTTAPATTIVCRNAVTVEDRVNLNVYADVDNHKLLDDTSCTYNTPDGN